MTASSKAGRPAGLPQRQACKAARRAHTPFARVAPLLWNLSRLPGPPNSLMLAVQVENAAAVSAAAADMKERLEELMKERSDRFDEMIVDEERIRLGEEGWKDRCGRVSRR